jgi:hypothetical protein
MSHRTIRTADGRATSAALALAMLLIGCSAATPPPGGRLAAGQQLLATEAVDRALAQVEWPNFRGRSVYVDVGSPAAEDERHYLESAVMTAIAERGAKITPDLKSADYVVVVLGKAVGVDEKKTFFGVPALQSSLLPVGLPEIALYKATEQKGIAKLETVVANNKPAGHVVRQGPVESETFVRDRRILVFNRHDTNMPGKTDEISN